MGLGAMGEGEGDGQRLSVGAREEGEPSGIKHFSLWAEKQALLTLPATQEPASHPFGWPPSDWPSPPALLKWDGTPASPNTRRAPALALQTLPTRESSQAALRGRGCAFSQTSHRLPAQACSHLSAWAEADQSLLAGWPHFAASGVGQIRV